MCQIDINHLTQFLGGLFKTPGHIGFHKESNEYIIKAFAEFKNLELTELPKGTLLYRWPGGRDDSPRALTAHTDTLGFLVREIKNSGCLKLTSLGGISWPGAENENVTVRTQNDERIRGTLILSNPGTHVN